MRRVTLILACAFIFVFALSNQTNAAVPQLINYQGVLTDSTGAGLETTVDIIFGIYENAVGLTPIWVEAHAGVIVTGGLFGVLLGSTTPLDVSIFGDTTRYLGVTVGADPEISPRTRLVTVAYSFRSEQADSADLAVLALHADTADFADTAALAVLALVAELAIFADSSRVADSLDGFSSEDFSRTDHSHGSGWIPFPFAAGFNDYASDHAGSDFQLVQYRKIGDVVYLRGLAHKTDHSALNGLIGTLPVGFRPTARRRFAAFGNNGEIAIFTNGDVIGASVFDNQTLDGIFFSQ